MNTLRIGALALLAAAALSLCGLALDDAIYQPVRELPGKWVDGHFQSERFWIAGRANGYVIDLEVPDTRVSTLDSEVDLPDQHFTQRCGRPFSEGVTWSLRRFGRVMTQHTSADQLGQGLRNTAQQRADGEHGNGYRKHATRTEAVA